MFRVDDGFYDSLKVKSIPRGAARKGAIALWTFAGSWSDKHSQDGLIPAGQVEELGGTRKEADWLLTSELWHDENHPCPRDPDDEKKPCPPVPRGYYLFHDYGDWNDLKIDKDKRRAATRERMRKLRNGEGTK
ncbi:hypothetical protein [uncultured Jatrophihabitans sp.]|uniref:hypothetical protein n=1 Tax=uncultured Jatrophihabitans sp. TaxID=1610747 RepID=UPI0035CB0DD2